MNLLLKGHAMTIHRIIIIKEYRKKAIFLTAIAAFWILMFITASQLIHRNLGFDTSVISLREYLTYQSPDGSFSFDYPSSFTVTPRTFSQGDIKSHVDFRDREGGAYGFVQIWSLTQPVKEFLEKSKAASRLKYKYFNTKELKISGLPAYYWDYSVLANNTYIKGSEMFIEDYGNKMYRISYFIPENLWNGNQNEIFMNMVKSFKAF